jgi:ribonuclease P protein component
LFANVATVFVRVWQPVTAVPFCPPVVQKGASVSVHSQPVQADVKRKPGRLKKRPEFLYVAEKGQKWVSDTVIVQALETDKGEVRFGFTATKKVGNAVVRNRTKRRLRAAADEIVKTHNLKPADIVLIARDTTVTGTWEDLLRNLTWCLRRLNLL